MVNKEENSNLVETRSGVTDQTEAAPAVGAGVDESQLTDPDQAEPLPGDRNEMTSDDSTIRYLESRALRTEDLAEIGVNADVCSGLSGRLPWQSEV